MHLAPFLTTSAYSGMKSGVRAGAKDAVAWKLLHHTCVWVHDASSASKTSPRTRSCCHIPSSTVNPWGVSAASSNPEQAFPVEPTHSEDDEIIHRFTGRDSLSSAIFSLRSRKLTVKL